MHIFITGKIIDFRSHHQLKSARLDCREPARRSRAKRARRSGGKASVDQQIAHIAWLLRELEDIARGGGGLPQVVVAQAHASIERTRTMLQSWPTIKTSGKTAATEEAAQPHIDPALLDRMYRDLGLHP
jgi:hypothetical protein